MAIKKAKSHKGIQADYWRINDFYYDDVKKEARVDLWLYASEEAKNANLKDNALRRDPIVIDNPMDIDIPEPLRVIVNMRDLMKTMLYLKIMESKLDADGNETNWYADAETV